MALLYVDRPYFYDGFPPSTTYYTPIVTADGFLQNFLELPVDIFAEICAYFEPLDLWNISISGRAFWDILTSPDLGPIWAAARFRLYGPMPAPPEDLSEPQYTRFLFTNKCYTCDGRATEIDYSNKVKSCPNCFEDKYLTLEEAMVLFPGLPVQDYLRAVRGRSNLWGQKRHYLRTAVVPKFRLYIDHISNGGSETEFEARLQERYCLNVKNGEVIRTWMENENARQQRKLEARYARRKASILSRMAELGHDRMDVGFGAAESLELLYLPYNVTDEEWAEMRSALEESATLKKALRRAEPRPLGCRYPIPRWFPRVPDDE